MLPKVPMQQAEDPAKFQIREFDKEGRLVAAGFVAWEDRPASYLTNTVFRVANAKALIRERKTVFHVDGKVTRDADAPLLDNVGSLQAAASAAVFGRARKMKESTLCTVDTIHAIQSVPMPAKGGGQAHLPNGEHRAPVWQVELHLTDGRTLIDAGPFFSEQQSAFVAIQLTQALQEVRRARAVLEAEKARRGRGAPPARPPSA